MDSLRVLSAVQTNIATTLSTGIFNTNQTVKIITPRFLVHMKQPINTTCDNIVKNSLRFTR